MKRTFSLFAACAPFALFAQGAGSLDTSFDPGSGTYASIHAMELQPDGRILVGGNFSSFAGSSLTGIARLLPSGTRDTSFDPGAGVTGPQGASWINAIAVQPDGKILIAGDFTSVDGQSVARVGRLNSDGSFDATFNVGTGANADIHGMAVDAEGRVLVTGFLTSFNGQPCAGIARLLPDGTFDATFQTPVLFPELRSVALQPDGKILIGGDFGLAGSSGPRNIARLNSDGSLDADFQSSQFGFIPGGVRAMALQPDGKILIGGALGAGSPLVYAPVRRLNSNGTLDASFTWSGLTSSGYVARSIALQSDGYVLVAGTIASNLVWRFARLLPDGTLDNAFNANTGSSVGTNGITNCVRVQTDGRILLSGTFGQFNGVERPGIVRVLGSDVTSVADLDGPQPVQLWPNPASDLLHLSEKRSGSILDARGRLVAQFGMQDVIDVRGFSPGLYSIAFEQGGLQRFVVH